MKIAVIIPTRGDRKDFMHNSMRMLVAQTLKPVHIELMDAEPVSAEKDITKRYREGYKELCGQGFDVICLWEDDDYYAPVYLETMAKQWLAVGRPDIFGTNYTIYYHLRLRRYFTIYHGSRASAMNTFLKPDLNFEWPQDNEPYTDLRLWNQTLLKPKQKMPSFRGVTFKPEQIISIGIKHGTGLCGGRNHNDYLDRFKYPDPQFEWLKQNMDAKAFQFYSNYFAAASEISTDQVHP